MGPRPRAGAAGHPRRDPLNVAAAQGADRTIPGLQRTATRCVAPGTSVGGEAAANRQDPHHGPETRRAGTPALLQE